MQSVIRIHEGDKFSLRRLYAGIARHRYSLIPQCENPHIIISFPQSFTYLAGCIRGTVVDDNKFQIAVRLVLNALNTIFQIILSVVDRDDHADQRGIFVHNRLPCYGICPLSKAQFFQAACGEGQIHIILL